MTLEAAIARRPGPGSRPRCRRSAGSRSAAPARFSSSTIGSSTWATWATKPTRVLRGRSRPCRLKIPSWRCSGKWSAYFETTTCASRPFGRQRPSRRPGAVPRPSLTPSWQPGQAYLGMTVSTTSSDGRDVVDLLRARLADDLLLAAAGADASRPRSGPPRTRRRGRSLRQRPTASTLAPRARAPAPRPSPSPPARRPGASLRRLATASSSSNCNWRGSSFSDFFLNSLRASRSSSRFRNASSRRCCSLSASSSLRSCSSATRCPCSSACCWCSDSIARCSRSSSTGVGRRRRVARHATHKLGRGASRAPQELALSFAAFFRPPARTSDAGACAPDPRPRATAAAAPPPAPAPARHPRATRTSRARDACTAPRIPTGPRPGS